MFRLNSTDKQRTFSQKYAGPLWIIAGALFVLSATFGDGKSEYVAIGIMFIVLGIVFTDKESKLDNSQGNESD
jgi:hypothetical protein